MKPRKKNNFWTFIFSFCPGAAEMYMGFFKNGLSILTIFCIPLIITGVLYGGDYLAILSVVVYVAAFFHARCLATTPDADFEALQDKYIWEEFIDGKSISINTESAKKWGSAILIFIGIFGLFEILRDNLYSMLDRYGVAGREMIMDVVDSIPRLVFSIFVIVVGVLIIRGKKKELLDDEHE